MIWIYDSLSYTSNDQEHQMSRITDCIKDDLPLYADDPRCSGLLQNEEILKAIALLEANKFQVHFQPGVDIVGSLNYNIKWVSELLSEKKELQAEIEQLKTKAQKAKKSPGVKL